MACICEDYLEGMTAIPASCEVGKGFKCEGVLINYNDIQSITRDAQNKQIVSAITLKDGAKGYKVSQMAKNAFNGTNVSLEVGDTRSTWTSQVSFKIFSDSDEVTPVCNALANGSFVMIVRGKTINEKGEFQIFGLTNGLMASEITREGNGDDGFVVNVTMEETEGASFQSYLWSTNAETTLAAFEALMA